MKQRIGHLEQITAGNLSLTVKIKTACWSHLTTSFIDFYLEERFTLKMDSSGPKRRHARCLPRANSDAAFSDCLNLNCSEGTDSSYMERVPVNLFCVSY